MLVGLLQRLGRLPGHRPDVPVPGVVQRLAERLRPARVAALLRRRVVDARHVHRLCRPRRLFPPGHPAVRCSDVLSGPGADRGRDGRRPRARSARARAVRPVGEVGGECIVDWARKPDERPGNDPGGFLQLRDQRRVISRLSKAPPQLQSPPVPTKQKKLTERGC